MNGRISRPCLWTLPSSLKTLYIDDLSKDDKSDGQAAAFQLITDAAQRADNIGVDEFTPEWFDEMLQYSDVAVLLYQPSDEQTHRRRLLGLVVLAESRFTRSAHTTGCQLFIVTAADLCGRQVHVLLVLMNLYVTF